eukprot:8075447-Alexandrium_andersonii.AAC.1
MCLRLAVSVPAPSGSLAPQPGTGQIHSTWSHGRSLKIFGSETLVRVPPHFRAAARAFPPPQPQSPPHKEGTPSAARP